MTTIKLFEVGGAVRDHFLGISSKDVDFAVEIPNMVGRPAAEGFAEMRSFMEREGFRIFLETPEFLTIRAQFPAGAEGRGRPLNADFVLCRRDGAYSDGRRPDEVTVGTLEDDLARRDFTVNAIAMARDGAVIDPHGGRADLANRTLRCVGKAQDRLREDSLRALRALRFSITKGFEPNPDLLRALNSSWLPPLLASVSTERKREELHRCFAHDTKATLDWLCHMVTAEFMDATFEGGLWLRPTQEKP